LFLTKVVEDVSQAEKAALWCVSVDDDRLHVEMPIVGSSFSDERKSVLQTSLYPCSIILRIFDQNYIILVITYFSYHINRTFNFLTLFQTSFIVIIRQVYSS